MANKTALELLAERNNDGRSALELALDNYELYYKANQALSQNKEYEINNGQNSKRRLTRADAKEIEQNMLYWENEVAKLQGTSLNALKIRTIFTSGIPQ
jgi:hypothetical protein